MNGRRFGAALLLVLLLSACQNNWFSGWQVRQLREQAQAAEAKGDLAFAVGKLRKAYGLLPSEKDLPLEIARLYAQMVREKPELTFEKQQGALWLYRAMLVDPERTETVMQKSPYAALKGDAAYDALAAHRGTPPENAIVGMLQHLNAVMNESLEASRQIGRVVSFLVDLAHRAGVQVLGFLAVVLLCGMLLRQLGFLFGLPLWTVSFVAAAALWHMVYRVASGGNSGGWEPLVKVAVAVLLLVAALRLAGFVLRLLGYYIRRAWLTSAVGQKFSRAAWRLRWQHMTLQPQISEAALRREVFHLEEICERFAQASRRYLLSASADERRELSLTLDELRREIHALTLSE